MLLTSYAMFIPKKTNRDNKKSQLENTSEKISVEAYVCRRVGHLALSGDPDTEKVDSAHTEVLSCHGGSHHTRHHSRLPSLQNEQHRSDTNQSDRDSYTLKGK